MTRVTNSRLGAICGFQERPTGAGPYVVLKRPCLIDHIENNVIIVWTIEQSRPVCTVQ